MLELSNEGTTLTSPATANATDMRERIVSAGYKMLLQFGENKTSMGDIAEAAGISRGTVYRYFGDRDQLLDAVIEYSAHRYWDAVDARIDDSMSLAEKLETRIRTSIRFSSGLVDQLSAGSVDLYRRMLAGKTSRTVELSVERNIPMLEKARERGELGDDVDIRMAADWITRSVLSMIWIPTSTVVDLSDEKAAARYATELILRGIGA
ncbi:TetR/AcrR family transcriptional regulator [Candidatus Poriferisocius sp.]|uniref:TetR/AcrR family transcriptional regulator n=1 Tax=Candidatus Poriferisocius sp. TaxID=3101276 RepID=UPI003B020B33